MEDVYKWEVGRERGNKKRKGERTAIFPVILLNPPLFSLSKTPFQSSSFFLSLSLSHVSTSKILHTFFLFKGILLGFSAILISCFLIFFSFFILLIVCNDLIYSGFSNWFIIAPELCSWFLFVLIFADCYNWFDLELNRFFNFMDAEESKNSRRSLRQPNKRRKIASDVSTESREQRKWRTEAEQQIYSSKLAEALRRVRRRRQSAPLAKSPINGRLVRETADSVLAASAKGRTRWSRAILASRFRQRLARRRRTKKLFGRKPSFVAEAKSEKIRKLPAVQRKAKILGRLVPGCRKLSFPNLLEEATDYISALEMQVRAMAALAELLTGAQSNLVGISNDSWDWKSESPPWVFSTIWFSFYFSRRQ